MTGRLFIFGLGYSGLEIAKLARSKGWSVGGTVTTADKAAQLSREGIDAHAFDGSAPLTAESLAAATHVLCSIAPGTTGDPVRGGIVASLMLTMIPEGLRVLGEDNYRLLVYGTMVLFVLWFLPSGIGGLIERLRK